MRSSGKNTVIKVMAACLTGIILIAGIGGFTYFVLEEKKERAFRDSVMLADELADDLEYEEAEDAWQEAIEIKKEESEPYIALAEIYLKENKIRDARKILDEAEQVVLEEELEEIENKYKLYAYAEEELIPKLGRTEEGEYSCGYQIEEKYILQVEAVSGQEGVMNWRIRDFDRDGEEELFVVLLEYYADDRSTYSREANRIVLQMYENEEGQIEKTAEYPMRINCLGAADMENSGVFLQESENRIYICAGIRNKVYVGADGSYFETVVFTYDGEFQEYTVTEEPVAGSSFENLKVESEEMAASLEKIGLRKSADEMRDSWMQIFQFDDEIDDLLVHIEGENDGTFKQHIMYGNRDISAEDYGKVELTLTLPKEDIEQDAE